MKDTKKIISFLIKTMIVIICISIFAQAIVLGGFYYSVNKTNTHTKYYDDIYQVSVSYPDAMIYGLINSNRTDYEVRVITTDKNDFSQDKIKTIEFTNHGDSHIEIYYKGKDNSLKWLFAKKIIIEDIEVKYYTSYSNESSTHYTHAQFKYNDRYYKIIVENEAETALKFITEIIKAMV